MLDFESCFSLEKLVVDAEIIHMARRLIAGVEPRGDSLAVEVVREVGHSGEFLEHPHTRQWFREELLIPSPVVDRDFRREWEAKGELDTVERAHQRAEKLLADWQPKDLPDEVVTELERITLAAASAAGMDALPDR
jgi:trimethylamine--corrinoid protein Co-methyltransferase